MRSARGAQPSRCTSVTIYVLYVERKDKEDEYSGPNRSLGGSTVSLLERLRAVAGSDFARVTYTEAVEVLNSSGSEFESGPPQWYEPVANSFSRLSILLRSYSLVTVSSVCRRTIL